MTKTTKTGGRNLRELAQRRQEVCERIAEIAAECERENRARNEAETTEYDGLCREMDVIDMQIRAHAENYAAVRPNVRQDVERLVRENIAANRQTPIRLVRDVMLVENVSQQAGEAYIPITVGEFIKPLEEGTILSQLPGLHLLTGLAGDYVWPVYENVEATIEAEGEALGDSQIPLEMLKATFNRAGLALPVTKETLNQTSGVIETLIRELMPKALALLMNKVTLSPSIINPNAQGLIGPFARIKEDEKETPGAVITLSHTPTFAELNAMKAKVLESGVDGENLCWVMSKSMEARLEGEAINSKGIFKPVAEGHKVCGLPVFTSHYINHDQEGEEKQIKINGVTKTVNGNSGAEYIGLGDWRYMAQALFGEIDMVVDPYSMARKHAIDFVLNANPGIKVLRKEAFALGKCAEE